MWHLYGSIFNAFNLMCLNKVSKAIMLLWTYAKRLCNFKLLSAVIKTVQDKSQTGLCGSPKYKGYQKYKYAFYFHSRPHLEVKQVVQLIKSFQPFCVHLTYPKLNSSQILTYDKQNMKNQLVQNSSRFDRAFNTLQKPVLTKMSEILLTKSFWTKTQPFD